MKDGWETKKLGDLCQPTNNIKWGNENGREYKYVDLSSVSRNALSITNFQMITGENAPSRAKKIIERNDVIFATTRPTLKRVTIIDEKFDSQICSTGFCVLRPIRHVIDSKYLFYNILTDRFMEYVEKNQKGASYPAVTDSQVKDYRIPYPPLPEQKRIVQLLDLAFAAIDKAKANAEKNLHNSRELFESWLNSVFANPGDGWDEKRFIDVCTLQRGFDLPKRLRKSGEFPLASSSGIIDSHCEYKVKGPGVVTGRSGSIGNVFHISEDYWPLNTVLYVKDFHGNNTKFIYHFLKPKFLN